MTGMCTRASDVLTVVHSMGNLSSCCGIPHRQKWVRTDVVHLNSVTTDGKKGAKEESVDGTSAQELEVSNGMDCGRR